MACFILGVNGKFVVGDDVGGISGVVGDVSGDDGSRRLNKRSPRLYDDNVVSERAQFYFIFSSCMLILLTRERNLRLSLEINKSSEYP